MPPSDPRRPGDDRSSGDRPSARGRRGRAVVAGTFLAALAIVLGVLLLVPRCGSEVRDSGSSAGSGPAVEQVDRLPPG